MKKIFIGICNSQDYQPSDFFWSIIGQSDFVAQPVFARGGHPSDIVRNNQLIAGFLESDCDYFAKTDIDQFYPPDYFKTMVPLIEKYKVMGPLLFDRWPGGDFMPLVNWAENGYKKHHDIKEKVGIVSVPYLHTNCFFHREVLEKIPKPWYEDRLSPDGLKRANNVDITFMKKIVKVGYKIYINFDVVVEHLALIRVNREVYERWNKNA